jgi:hypothetical protein
VTYDTKKSNPEAIKKALAEEGFPVEGELEIIK